MAAEVSSQSVLQAGNASAMQMANDAGYQSSQIQENFINNIKFYMSLFGGRVDATGSKSPNIKVNEAKYDWF